MTDEEILSCAANAADALDATRVNEMRPGGWHATTIFDGDAGLIRFGRLIEKAVKAAPAEVVAPKRYTFQVWSDGEWDEFEDKDGEWVKWSDIASHYGPHGE